MSDNILDEVAKDWVKARNIIVEFLKEICPNHVEMTLQHNASAIIARLAHANMIIETTKIN